MNPALYSLNLPFLMDVLALGASAVLIVVLIANRRRYGRLIATASDKSAFGSEMTLQMVAQQSQRSHSRIQKTLNREFANLQRMAGGEDAPLSRDPRKNRPATAAVSPTRAGHYAAAARMIRNGVDQQAIAARCGLSRGAIDLMTYMQHKRS